MRVSGDNGVLVVTLGGVDHSGEACTAVVTNPLTVNAATSKLIYLKSSSTQPAMCGG